MKFELKTGMLILFIILALFYGNGFEDYELKTIDYRFNLRGAKTPGNEKVVMIGVTDNCCQSMGWPIPRATYGKVLNSLKKKNASVIGMDIIFDISRQDSGDLLLIDGVKKAENVILPISFSKITSINPDNGEIEEKLKLMEPMLPLKENCKGTGYINLWYKNSNADGIARSVPLKKQVSGKPYLAFSNRIYSLYDNQDNENLPEQVYVNYRGNQNTFEMYPFYDYYNGMIDNQEQLDFTNKIVLIGPWRTGEDNHLTPFGPMPGMEIHANLIQNLIDKNWMVRWSKEKMLFTLIFLSFLSSVLLGKFRHFSGFLVFVFLIISYSGIVYWCFVSQLLIIDVVPVLVLLVFQYFIITLGQVYYNLWDANLALDNKIQELTLLYDISNSISMGLITKKDEQLQSLLDKMVDGLKARRGSLMLLDPLTEELTVEVVSNIELPKQDEKIRIPLGQGIAGMVAKSKEPMIVDKGFEDERFLKSGEKNSRVESLLCVPMLVYDRPVGVINLVNRIGKSGFTKEDMNLAMTVAQQAGSVIENARLYTLATVDGMTGLYNNRHFTIRLQEELLRAKRYGKKLSLLMTDIDHFKNFNDSYGHQTGDVVLIGVADVMKETVRDIDIPARYGGEEFIVILPETSEDGAYLLAERLRKNIEEKDFQTSHGILHVTTSIGVVTYPIGDIENPKKLIGIADHGLYKSKEGGRNCTSVADESWLPEIVWEE